MSNNPYTQREEHFIRNNYQKLSDKEIAEHLNRCENGIHVKRVRLGLQRERQTSDKILSRMQDLIFIIPFARNIVQAEKYKKELRKLSGL